MSNVTVIPALPEYYVMNRVDSENAKMVPIIAWQIVGPKVIPLTASSVLNELMVATNSAFILEPNKKTILDMSRGKYLSLDTWFGAEDVSEAA